MMLFNPQAFHQNFNLFEAGFWFVCAFVLPILFRRYLTPAEKVSLFITLIVFGISDLIEVQTGAWWRPWWLLAIKGVCLIALGGLLKNLWQSVHRVKQD